MQVLSLINRAGGLHRAYLGAESNRAGDWVWVDQTPFDYRSLPPHPPHTPRRLARVRHAPQSNLLCEQTRKQLFRDRSLFLYRTVTCTRLVSCAPPRSQLLLPKRWGRTDGLRGVSESRVVYRGGSDNRWHDWSTGGEAEGVVCRRISKYFLIIKLHCP